MGSAREHRVRLSVVPGRGALADVEDEPDLEVLRAAGGRAHKALRALLRRQVPLRKVRAAQHDGAELPRAEAFPGGDVVLEFQLELHEGLLRLAFVQDPVVERRTWRRGRGGPGAAG